MISNLKSSERQYALLIAVAVALAGLAMAALGRSDTLGVHGVIVMLFAGVVIYLLMSSFYGAEPTEDRAVSYY
ncbi:MAG: cytochrome-c oxidase, cbb3-type subunit I, partial [Mesorhizobium sp.]